MPLTPSEIDFLGPVVDEYSRIERGPVWTLLNERDIWQADMIWMMEAYHIADPLRLVNVENEDGTFREELQFGRKVRSLPECPWPDAQTARRRNTEMEHEVAEHRRRVEE